MECQVDDVVVTLVHGTWRPDARWTKPGSRLYESLSTVIAGCGAISTFRWSGRNTPNARFKAALELSRHLKTLIEEKPLARHFVIGHSHGGNVALKAVEMADLFKDVGIVCLSTPFLNIKTRFRTLIKDELEVAWYGILAMAALPLLVRTQLFSEHRSVRLIVIAGVGVVVLLLRKGWSKSAESFRSKIVVTVPASAKLLIVRTVADEAAAAIAFFQIIAWAASRIGMAYVRAICFPAMIAKKLNQHTGGKLGKLAKLSKKLLLICFLLLAAVAIDFHHHYHQTIAQRYPWTSPPWMSFMDEDAGHRGLGLFILGSPITLLALAVLAGTSLPMGFGNFAGALQYEVTVEPVPLGVWQIHQVSTQSDGETFMHSSSYENEEVVTTVTDWIGETAKKATNASRCED